MATKFLLSSAALFIGALANEDLVYPDIHFIEDTEIKINVKCNGSDTGTCKGVTVGEEVCLNGYGDKNKCGSDYQECPVPTDSLKAKETIDLPCLSEVGAVYPEEEKSDILMVTVTIPKDAADLVGLNKTAPIAADNPKLKAIQLRLCFTPTFSTNKRAWRTNDSKENKNRIKRDKSCAKIVKVGEEEEKSLPFEENKTVYEFEYKVPQTTPIGLMYPQVRYLCDDSEGSGFDQYKTPTNNVCGYFPARGEPKYMSFRTRPISVENLSRIRGPLIALMFVAPLFLACYFLKDFIFRKD